MKETAFIFGFALIILMISCEKENNFEENSDQIVEVKSNNDFYDPKQPGTAAMAPTRTLFENPVGPDPLKREYYCTAPASDCYGAVNIFSSLEIEKAIEFDSLVNVFALDTGLNTASLIIDLFPDLDTKYVDSISNGMHIYVKIPDSNLTESSGRLYSAFDSEYIGTTPVNYLDLDINESKYTLELDW